MGERGPVPKRESQRRRNNKPERPVTKGRGAAAVEVPKPNGKWHPLAKRLFAAAAGSGQAEFYEPSDWALLELACEQVSRELRPQVVGVTDAGPVKAEVPMKAATLAALRQHFAALLLGEGDRRRAGVELTTPDVPSAEPAAVTDIRSWRESLNA